MDTQIKLHKTEHYKSQRIVIVLIKQRVRKISSSEMNVKGE
jgi:hypothetical protein